MPFDVYCDGIAFPTHPEALVMLRQDDHCKDGTTPDVVPAGGWPDGGLGWDSAPGYVGIHKRVGGPLASMRNTADGAFVNVGLDYPNPGRFTFILGGYEAHPLPATAVVCASGTI